jgi:uncharacterized protein YbjT (DUF2867 family)
MRSLVFGATGYTGRHVVAELARRGHSVVAHIRPESGPEGVWENRFSALGASAVRAGWEPRALARLVSVSQPEIVFALIGTTRKRAAREGVLADDIYERIDRALTSLALEAVREYAPAARFVYLSAVGVQPGTRNPYLRARARIEAELRASGLSFTIARPSFITGSDREDNRPLERGFARFADVSLKAAAALGAPQFAERYQSMTGAELGAGLVQGALDDQCRGRVLEVGELRRLAAQVAHLAVSRHGTV